SFGKATFYNADNGSNLGSGAVRPGMVRSSTYDKLPLNDEEAKASGDQFNADKSALQYGSLNKKRDKVGGGKFTFLTFTKALNSRGDIGDGAKSAPGQTRENGSEQTSVGKGKVRPAEQQPDLDNDDLSGGRKTCLVTTV